MSEIIDCMVFIVQKTCWTMWKFVEFVGLRILDLLGLIFNILACATIIRLPCMLRQFQDMESMDEWRYVGLVQFLIFLVDIPVIIMGLTTIALTLGLILIPFTKKVKRKKVKCDYTHKEDDIYFGGFQLRGIVVGYFCRVICDIFCVPLGLICLCSWRCLIFTNKIKKVEKWDEFKWRKICIVQFIHLLLDIPCVICGLLLLFTWRGPYLVIQFKGWHKDDNLEWNVDRFRVFLELLFLITDVMFFMISLVVLVTWRGPLMVYDLIHAEADDDDYDEDDCCSTPLNLEWTLKSIILKQFALIFVDIPCILCAFIVMITMWRFPRFVRKCKKDEWELRANCVTQFGLLMIDFAFLLLNIFCAFLSLLIVLTLWRAYPLVRDLKKYFKQRAEIGQANDNEAQQQQDKKAIKMLKNANSWKLRKAVFKHFAFFFVDIPAILACLVIFITMVRLPKLLSSFLQTGDFFMEFALVSFTHLARLVVDLLFLILFIILMTLRPVQSWVHLLEDEDHRKNRLLRFYMQWVPDIIEKRHQMYREMEEVFSSSLKNKLSSSNIRINLSHINAEFLRDLQWLRDKLNKYDLDAEYNHLLHLVQFYEGKRAYKMERLYKCELNYLHCVDAVVHNENLTKYRNEMLRFESQADSAIQALRKFNVGKVLLWSEECGLKTRTRKETQMVLIKCLPSGRFLTTILILVNLILVYRGPALIRNLYRRWYDRRNIVLASLREYFQDFLTILIILLVILTLYRAPFLLMEVSNDIISKRSWTAVRETVRRYPPKFARDLVDFIILVFSWKTVRFIFTEMLFGILMPADLFLTVMKFLFGNLCLAAFCTTVLYIGFFGFPFLLVFAVAPLLLASGSGSSITVAIGVMGILLIVILVLAAILTFRHRDETVSVRPKAYDYVRFNWNNFHAILFEVVEFLQLLALVFVVPGIPMYGGATLNQASHYLLLNFATFQFKFWMTTTLFILWFFICGLPVIFEQVLETFPKGTFAKQISWTLLVSLFTNTLFVTLIESLLGFVACNYNVQCGPLSSSFSARNISNETNCASAVLYDDVAMTCWSGPHAGIATFGLLALVWYSTTAIIFGTRYGDSNHPSLDLKFSPVYNTFINFIKALMVGCAVLAVASPYAVFALLVVLNLAALGFTLCFRRVVGFMLSNSFVLIMWRIVSFVCAAIAAIAAVIGKLLNDRNSLVPLCVFLGGTGVVLVLAICVSVFRVVRRALTPIEHKRKEFKTCLRQLEEKLIRDNHMVISWQKNRKRWGRLLRHVYEAQNDGDDRSSNRTLGLPEEILAPRPENRLSNPRMSLEMSRGIPGRSSLIDTLPPPPSYQELFPHIMTPYDALPPPPPYTAEYMPTEAVPMTSPIRLSIPNYETLTNATALADDKNSSSNNSIASSSADDTGEGLVDKDTQSSDSNQNVADKQSSTTSSSGSNLEVRVDIETGEILSPSEETEIYSRDGIEPVHSPPPPPLLPLDMSGRRASSSRDGIEPVPSPPPPPPSPLDMSGRRASSRRSSIDSEGGSERSGKFDSLLFLECHFRAHETRQREPDPVLAMECNGKNLLLVLEEHTHYSAYSFAFVTQLPMWRLSVECADWTRLMECFRILESNLSGAFNFPSRVDVTCADQCTPLLRLSPDPDQVPIPTYVPEPRDPEEIRALSNVERSRCLQDIVTVETHGSKWASLLDKVFPTRPVFKKWLWDDKTLTFTIIFHRPTRGTIIDIGPRGLKLAKGAVISMPKVLKGQFTSSNEILFVKGCEPKGSKGPVSVTVSELGILDLNEKLYITAQGKRIGFDKAMDCLYEMEWK